MKYYFTLKKPVEFEGIGIHTGEPSKIKITPSEFPGSGIYFFISDKKINLSLENIKDTNLCTTIGTFSFKISTVEHLLSTLYGLFINDVEIHVIKGREIPILDGSAKLFVKKILEAGLKRTNSKIKIIQIVKSSTFKINNSLYKISPSRKFEIVCSLKTEKSKYLNDKISKFIFTSSNYIKNIAPAKTFCLFDDIKNILSSKKGLGGSLDNVIVVDSDRVINPEILTYKKNECLRHKILDFLGDLSFLKVYFKGKFEIINPGHYANLKFCEYLKKRRIIYE
ncbi:MAG: UDP-3-O-acyl-N-acetylglucosamine deacetylase [Endomicrobiia bacterium]